MIGSKPRCFITGRRGHNHHRLNRNRSNELVANDQKATDIHSPVLLQIPSITISKQFLKVPTLAHALIP